MKVEYRRNLVILLSIVAVCTLFYAVSHTIEGILNNPTAISHYIMDFFYAVDVFFLVFYAIRLNKFKVLKHMKMHSLMIFIGGFFFWVIALLLSFFNRGVFTPMYYVSMVICILAIGSRIALIVYINKIFEKEKLELLLFKRLAMFYITMFVIALMSYITPMILGLIGEAYNLAGITSVTDIPISIFIVLIIHLVLGIIAYIFTVYIGIIILIAMLEKKALDFKHNYIATVHAFNKYHLNFYFSAVGLTLLLVTSIFTSITISYQSRALVLLFGTLLFVKIVTFIWVRILEYKHPGDHVQIFKIKHWIMLFAGLSLLAFAVGQFFIGNAAISKIAGKQDYSIVLTLAVFFPWALFRLVIGLLKYHNAKKSKDPTLYVDAILSIQHMIYTVNTAIYLLAISLNNFVIAVIAIIVTFASLIYNFVISLIFVVTAIEGLRGHKQKQLETYLKHIETMNKKNLAIEEALSEI